MFLTHWGTPREVGASVDTEHLWRNDTVDGVIRFTDVSLAAGIAADFKTSRYFVNNTDGTFSNATDPT